MAQLGGIDFKLIYVPYLIPIIERTLGVMRHMYRIVQATRGLVPIRDTYTGPGSYCESS